VAEKCVDHFIAHMIAVKRGVQRAAVDVACGYTGKRGMQQWMDLVASHVRGIAADHPRRGRIDERSYAIEIHPENTFGRRIEDQLILPAQPRQLVRLAGDGLRLPEEFDED